MPTPGFIPGQVLTAAELNAAFAATAAESDMLQIQDGTATSAGTLTGAETVPTSRGTGLLQTTLTVIAQWVIQTFQGFVQNGTGAVTQSVQTKARQVVSAADFIGFDATGLTDSTAAILNAAASLGASGGVVTTPAGAKVLINSNLALPPNVGLVGPYYFVGTPGSNSSAPYGNLGALILNATKTITLGAGATISGCLIYPSGMTFPQPNSASWTGTAVTVGGDDAGLFNSMVLGFNKAFYSSGYQRVRASYVLHDNINGIEITNCLDVPQLMGCHAWPFATIATFASNSDYTVLNRAGIAYNIHDSVDWAKLTDCFSYGYFVGFQINNANSATLLGCGADDTFNVTPQHSGAIGVVVEGTSNDTRLIAFQSSAHGSLGISINTSAGNTTLVDSPDVWAITSGDAISVGGGDVTISSGILRNSINGVTVSNAASRVLVDGVRFKGLTGSPINPTVSTTNITIGPNNQYDDVAAGGTAVSTAANMTLQTVASAPTLLIPAQGDYFTISGTTGFGSIQAGWTDRTITLLFQGTLTVFAGGASPTGMKLNGGSNFSAVADSTLTLRHNGSYWYEIGRKA